MRKRRGLAKVDAAASITKLVRRFQRNPNLSDTEVARKVAIAMADEHHKAFLRAIARRRRGKKVARGAIPPALSYWTVLRRMTELGLRRPLQRRKEKREEMER